MAPLRLSLVIAFLLSLVIVMQVSSVEAIDAAQARCHDPPKGGRGVTKEGCHNACQTRCRLEQDPYCMFTCVECCLDYLCVPSGLPGDQRKGECPCYEKDKRCP